MSGDRKRTRFRIWLRRSLWIVAGVLLLALGTGVYHTNKSLPPGISFAGSRHNADNVRFLRDLTYLDADGNRHVEQEIFDAGFKMIDEAEEFVLVDMFLYNDFQGTKPETTRAVCDEMTDRLIARKTAIPAIEIHVITDPINTVYGGMKSPQLERLKKAGIHVTVTDLTRLRDSNAVYSSFWRLFVKPFGNSEGFMVSNPFGEGKVSLRSYFALVNFKANHRKVIIADGSRGLVGLVTSANPHDGSSAHENVALRFSGAAAVDLLEAEKAVVIFSKGEEIRYQPDAHFDSESGLQVQVLTERKIKDAVLDELSSLNTGDSVDLIMFYLSDRDIVGAMKQAGQRGAEIRVVLDPNKDAFGHEKNGIPNRQVAGEFVDAGIQLRWADTHGEQMHTKLLLIRRSDGTGFLSIGSANFTRRNLDDLNLELNVAVSGSTDSAVFLDTLNYIELIWNNESNRRFTTEFESYSDDSTIRWGMYRTMEAIGVSTF